MIQNPYLDALKNVPQEPFDRGYMRRSPQYRSFQMGGRCGWTDYRADMVREFSWAIPSFEALHVITKFAPRICEIGAGTGYWAWMLTQYGASVIAYDLHVPGVEENKWGHKKTWFDVKQGDVLSINQHQDRALMLCWPPYQDPMSSAVLELYTGSKVIYIGEGSYGCTANEKFHDMLGQDFNEIDCVDLPQWDGIHDSLSLYERK